MIIKAKCLFCEAAIEGERNYMLSGTGLQRDGRRRPKWLIERPEFHWTWNGLGRHIFYLCPNHKDKLDEGFEWCKEQDLGGSMAKQIEKPPWERENWREAKGIIADEKQTNSALAERDYSVKCETPSQNLIIKVKGYWIWWCSTHHQPLAWCRIEQVKAEVAREIFEEIEKLKTPYHPTFHPLQSGGFETAIKEVQSLKSKYFVTLVDEP